MSQVLRFCLVVCQQRIILLALIGLISLVCLVESLPAQTPEADTAAGLRITRIDLSEFPTVTIQLTASGTQGEQPADLSRLSLRENGVPITDFALGETDIGGDVIFVIDANDSILNIDDAEDGRTRLEKVRDSLIRYGTQFMSPRGLDHVSVIVPGGETGRLLLQDVTRPADFVDAVEGYDPGEPGATPLQQMLALALTQAETTQNDGRAQAIVLFTDGAALDLQLDYEALIADAQELQIPFFAIIVGARADPNEIENVARLYDVLGGDFVHMPDAPEADPLFQRLQERGTQVEVSYRSGLVESGPLRVQVGLGNALAEALLTLELEPPTVTLAGVNAEIRRVGTAVDTPLSEMQPAVQPVLIQLTWPGELRVALEEAVLVVNGDAQPSPATPVVGADGTVQLDWDISSLDEGNVTLSVRLTDTLGRVIESEPVPVAITVLRPETLDITPVATIVKPEVEIPPAIAAMLQDPRPLAGVCGGLLLLMIAGLLFRFARRRRRKAAEQRAAEAARAAALAETEAGKMPRPEGFLILADVVEGTVAPIPLQGDDVTIGRDPKLVDIPLADESVARLHARIRYLNGDFWLYDEGSTTGTYLNFTRLGLAPQLLQENSAVHIGRVHFRFHVEKPPAA